MYEPEIQDYEYALCEPLEVPDGEMLILPEPPTDFEEWTQFDYQTDIGYDVFWDCGYVWGPYAIWHEEEKRGYDRHGWCSGVQFIMDGETHTHDIGIKDDSKETALDYLISDLERLESVYNS